MSPDWSSKSQERRQPPVLQSFETELLTQEDNLSGLAAINRELIARAEAIEAPQRVWCWTWIRLRFRCTGRRSRVPTTVTSSPPAITRCCCSTPRATVWLRGCGPATCIVRKAGPNCYCRRLSANKNWVRKVFRPDADFAKPEIYEALEGRGVKYAIRIPANDSSLQRDIAELLTRPVGRPSHKPVV